MRDINLISPDSDPQAQLRTVFGWFETALIIVMALMLAFMVWLQLERNTTVSQATLKKAERQKLKKDIDHASELEQKLATILDRQQTIKDLESKRQSYDLLLNDLAAATPPQLRLTSITTSSDGLTMSGVAAQRSDITQFIDNLNKNSVFSKVELSQANVQEDGVSFGVTLQFSQTASAETATSPNPTSSPEATPNASSTVSPSSSPATEKVSL